MCLIVTQNIFFDRMVSAPFDLYAYKAFSTEYYKAHSMFVSPYFQHIYVVGKLERCLIETGTIIYEGLHGYVNLPWYISAGIDFCVGLVKIPKNYKFFVEQDIEFASQGLELVGDVHNFMDEKLPTLRKFLHNGGIYRNYSDELVEEDCLELIRKSY